MRAEFQRVEDLLGPDNESIPEERNTYRSEIPSGSTEHFQERNFENLPQFVKQYENTLAIQKFQERSPESQPQFTKQYVANTLATQNVQERISENQPQFVKRYGNNTHVNRNHYQYVKWTLLFFLILFFGLMMNMYLNCFAEHVSTILQFLHLKK